MGKYYNIRCLDDSKEMIFEARTSYEALCKAIKYLNLSHMDRSAEIKISHSGLHFYADHNGKTYAVRA